MAWYSDSNVRESAKVEAEFEFDQAHVEGNVQQIINMAFGRSTSRDHFRELIAYFIENEEFPPESAITVAQPKEITLPPQAPSFPRYRDNRPPQVTIEWPWELKVGMADAEIEERAKRLFLQRYVKTDQVDPATQKPIKKEESILLGTSVIVYPVQYDNSREMRNAKGEILCASADAIRPKAEFAQAGYSPHGACVLPDQMGFYQTVCPKAIWSDDEEKPACRMFHDIYAGILHNDQWLLVEMKFKGASAKSGVALFNELDSLSSLGVDLFNFPIEIEVLKTKLNKYTYVGKKAEGGEIATENDMVILRGLAKAAEQIINTRKSFAMRSR